MCSAYPVLSARTQALWPLPARQEFFFCRCRCQLSISHYLYIMATSNQSGPSPLPEQPSTSGKSALYSNFRNYSPCTPQLHSSSLDFSMLPGLALAALAWVTLSQLLETALGESIQNSSQVGGQLARLAASAALTLTLETDIPPPWSLCRGTNLAAGTLSGQPPPVVPFWLAASTEDREGVAPTQATAMTHTPESTATPATSVATPKPVSKPIESPSLPSIPPHMLKNIEAGKYIDLGDLLPKALAEHSTGACRTVGRMPPLPPSVHFTVNTPLDWALAFSTYSAAATHFHQDKAAKLITYGNIILRPVSTILARQFCQIQLLGQEHQQTPISVSPRVAAAPISTPLVLDACRVALQCHPDRG